MRIIRIYILTQHASGNNYSRFRNPTYFVYCIPILFVMTLRKIIINVIIQLLNTINNY